MSDPTQPPVDPAEPKPNDSSVPPAVETPAVETPAVETPAAPAYPSYPAAGAAPAAAYGQAPAAPAAPAYSQPPAYGQNPYGQQSPQDKYNVLSIISLVTSLIGISLAGVITGHIGMSQIKKTGEKGRGLAIAGLVVGYLGLAAGIIGTIIFIAIVVGAASSGATYSTY